jgi:replicative DNA helicase
VAEVGEVARGLKDIGRELDIPVIALAQLNRNADKRESGKPILSDLRESAELETEADGVIAIYRPSAYDDTIEDKRKTELIILKNRHGPLGYTEVEFYHEFMRFAPYADSPYAGSQREAFLK